MESATSVSVVESTFGNASNGNNDTHLMELFMFYQTGQVIFLFVLFAFIAIGNTAVLVAIGLAKNTRSRMNFFIMHLAIADLLAGFGNVLPDAIWKITITWHGGMVFCKMLRYTQGVVTYASTYVLVALSLDRLDAIARPMHFTGSGTRSKVLIIAAWSLALVFSCPQIILNEQSDCSMHLPEPWMWKLYITLICVVLFIFPAIIIAVCYVIIVAIIWSKSKALSMDVKEPHKRHEKNGISVSAERLRISNSASSSRGVIPKAKIKTIKMTLVIVLVFILCWSPYFIFDLLDVYGHIPRSDSRIAMTTFIQSLAPLNSAANPIIYTLFSTRICSNWRYRKRPAQYTIASTAHD